MTNWEEIVLNCEFCCVATLNITLIHYISYHHIIIPTKYDDFKTYAAYLNKWLQHRQHGYSSVHPTPSDHSASVWTLIHYSPLCLSRFSLIPAQSEHNLELPQHHHSPALYTPLQHQACPTHNYTLCPTLLDDKLQLSQSNDRHHSPTSQHLRRNR